MSDDEIGLVLALAESPDIEADIGGLEPLPPEAFEADGPDEFFACGPTGGGLAGRRFRLRARTAALDLDFTLPCLMVMEDEESRRRQAADLKTVCSLFCSAARIAADGHLGGRRVIAVGAEEGDCTWRIVGPDGEDESAGSEWPELVDTFVRFADGTSGEDLVRIEG